MATDPRGPAAAPGASLRATLARSNRLALVLGAIAIALTCTIGALAFERGRDSMLQGYLDAALGEVRTRAAMLDLLGERALGPETLEDLERSFRAQSAQFPNASLVLIDATGVMRLNTGHKERVGQDVSRREIRTFGRGAPRTLGELIEGRREWAGFYATSDGSQQLAAFACAPRSGALLGVFLPRERVLAELDRATIPWLLGLALIALVLMPLALFLLNQSHGHAMGSLERTQESLRESEARLGSAIESLPCEFWLLGRDGRVLLQNSRDIRRAGEMRGRRLDEVGLDEPIARFWQENCARALAGETFEVEFERGHGGARQHFRAFVAPVRSGSEVLGVCVLEFDVTERRGTEAELALAHRTLDFHFENSPLALIERDAALRVRRWSQGAEHVFGWSAAEAQEKRFGDLPLTHPAEEQLARVVTERLLAGEPRVSAHTRNLRRDGHAIACEWFHSALRNERGELVSVLSICEDVTERMHSQAVERLHRDVLRAMLERKPLVDVLEALVLGLEQVIPGARGSILLREEGSARLRHAAAPNLPVEYLRAIDGLPVGPGPESAACGRACHERRPVLVEDVRADPVLQRLLGLLEPFGIRSIHSHPVLALDGEALGTFALYFGEPHAVHERESVLLDEAADLARVAIEYSRAAEAQALMTGRLSVLHEVGRQILQAVSVDELLPFAVESLRAATACLRVSVVLVEQDAGGAIRSLRLAAVSGAARASQPAGSTFGAERLGPERVAGLLRGETLDFDRIEDALPHNPELVPLFREGVRAMRMLPLTSRGTLVGLLNIAYAVPGPPPRADLELAREVAFLLGVAIVEQRLGEALRQHAFELEQRVLERTAQLTEVNDEMETYVHTVTHDLRAPLRTIQGFGQALLEDHAQELRPEAREYLARMIAGAERMETLMRELLAYSRLGRTELHLQGVDLDLVEREAEHLLASELDQRLATVEVPAPLGLARGHTPTLVQVLANLIGNAAKFVPPERKPRIRLRPEKRGARTRLWIEDNGIGIAPEHKDRIWGVFERLHGMEVYPGTGLGLAIVRRAMERMGGSCGVESAPGEGSHFWIELESVDEPARTST